LLLKKWRNIQSKNAVPPHLVEKHFTDQSKNAVPHLFVKKHLADQHVSTKHSFANIIQLKNVISTFWSKTIWAKDICRPILSLVYVIIQLKNETIRKCNYMFLGWKHVAKQCVWKKHSGRLNHRFQKCLSMSLGQKLLGRKAFDQHHVDQLSFGSIICGLYYKHITIIITLAWSISDERHWRC